MKLKYLAFLLCFLRVVLPNSGLAKDTLEIGKRVGLLSMFPGKLGMFYNDRAIFVDEKGKKSIFPRKDIKIEFDVNEDIVSSLLDELKTQHSKQHKFIPLPSFSDIEKHLTGYAIEGWWGAETNSVSIKELKPFFTKHELDTIIAIVPVTYYLPPIKSEASGMNLSFVGNKLYFSATYAVLIFSKTVDGYQKTYSSIKQVYVTSKSDFHKLAHRRYDQQHINSYYDLFQSDFLPHVRHQVKKLFEKGSSGSGFIQPQKPFHYYLPH